VEGPRPRQLLVFSNGDSAGDGEHLGHGRFGGPVAPLDYPGDAVEGHVGDVLHVAADDRRPQAVHLGDGGPGLSQVDAPVEDHHGIGKVQLPGIEAGCRHHAFRVLGRRSDGHQVRDAAVDQTHSVDQHGIEDHRQGEGRGRHGADLPGEEPRLPPGLDVLADHHEGNGEVGDIVEVDQLPDHGGEAPRVQESSPVGTAASNSSPTGRIR
jgi:hypothetical protein